MFTANKGDRFLAKSIIPNVKDQIVIYKGIQPGFDELPALALYDLTEELVGHPALSTVTRPTLEEYGFVLPDNAP